MLSQDDRRRLAELERRLLVEDPDFVARMTGRTPRRRSVRIVPLLACCLAWGSAAALMISGWWVAAFGVSVVAVVASVAVAYVAAT
jgi:fatty acid desaturase